MPLKSCTRRVTCVTDELTHEVPDLIETDVEVVHKPDPKCAHTLAWSGMGGGRVLCTCCAGRWKVTLRVKAWQTTIDEALS